MPTTISKLFPTGVLQTTVELDEMNISKSGSAQFLASSNKYLSVPANSAFTLGSNNHTIEFWMYQTSRGAYDTPFSYFGGATQQATNNYYFNAGTVFFGVLLGGAGSWAVQIGLGSPLPSLNEWHHYALVRNGSTFTVYVDGINRGSATSLQNISAQGAGGLMLIGAYDNAGSTPVTGYITNFRFVNGIAVYTGNFSVPKPDLTTVQTSSANTSAISGTETKLLLTHSTSDTLLKDSSVNNFTVTNNNSVTWSSFSPSSKFKVSTTGIYAAEFDEINLDISVAERRKSDGTYQVSGYLDETFTEL
jgi:hypothetical protein